MRDIVTPKKRWHSLTIKKDNKVIFGGYVIEKNKQMALQYIRKHKRLMFRHLKLTKGVLVIVKDIDRGAYSRIGVYDKNFKFLW